MKSIKWMLFGITLLLVTFLFVVCWRMRCIQILLAFWGIIVFMACVKMKNSKRKTKGA